MPHHGDGTQQAPIVRFYHLQRAKRKRPSFRASELQPPLGSAVGICLPRTLLGTYLLRGIDDTQAVAVLEEAQHCGEDGEDQRSCEVLGGSRAQPQPQLGRTQSWDRAMPLQNPSVQLGGQTKLLAFSSAGESAFFTLPQLKLSSEVTKILKNNPQTPLLWLCT